jgi:hypothetical protein
VPQVSLLRPGILLANSNQNDECYELSLRKKLRTKGTASAVPLGLEQIRALQAAEKVVFRVGRGFIPGVNAI